MNTSIENENKRKRWQHLWHELHAVRFQDLPTKEEVDQVLACLPPRLPDEKLSDWLARAQQPKQGAVVPFPRFRCTKLAEIRLKAAASLEMYPLPERPIETPNQLFRLTITKAEDGLQIYIEILGNAIEKYAGRYIGISDSDNPDSFAVVAQLDANGEYLGTIEDCEENRKALCTAPKFYLIESDDV